MNTRTPSRASQDRRQASGFTLVELLVVIGVIALLIGLLLPALSKARAAANQIKCSANLRTIGQALLQHANDHAGFMPLAGTMYVGPSPYVNPTSINLGDPAMRRYSYYDDQQDGRYFPTALPAALGPYLTSTTPPQNGFAVVKTYFRTGVLQEVFTCPSDDATLNRIYGAAKWIAQNPLNLFLDGWSSYDHNSEIFGWCDVGVGGLVGHSRCRGNLGKIPHPAETMLLCDGKPGFEFWVHGSQQHVSDVYLGAGSAGSGVFDLPRHRGAMNMLYVDGHVDNQPILSTGAITAVGAVGSAGNSPSEPLKQASMDVDFQ